MKNIFLIHNLLIGFTSFFKTETGKTNSPKKNKCAFYALRAYYCFIILITLSACKKHNDGVLKDNEIWLHNSVVEPYQTNITKGTTITFINKDNKTHTASEFNSKFYSGKLKPGNTFSYTFNDTGYFSFYCNYHNSILGKVIVK